MQVPSYDFHQIDAECRLQRQKWNLKKETGLTKGQVKLSELFILNLSEYRRIFVFLPVRPYILWTGCRFILVSKTMITALPVRGVRAGCDDRFAWNEVKPSIYAEPRREYLNASISLKGRRAGAATLRCRHEAAKLGLTSHSAMVCSATAVSCKTRVALAEQAPVPTAILNIICVPCTCHLFYVFRLYANLLIFFFYLSYDIKVYCDRVTMIYLWMC